MSSRKLSSEEVDALMDGLKSSNHDVNADVSGSSDVRAFQFGQDDLSLMGDYYALRLINERFARIARGVFLTDVAGPAAYFAISTRGENL